MKGDESFFKPAAHEAMRAYGVRPAADARFAMLDSQPTLFSAASQSLFTLNPVAAIIWCSLEGGGVRAAEAGLVAAGAGSDEARRYVDDAVANWLRIGLLDADFGPTQRRHACSFRVEKTRWRVEADDPRTPGEIARLFDPNPQNARETADARLRAIATGDDIHVYRDERRAFVCKADEVAPMVKSLIIEQVLADHRRELAFHAACMSRNGGHLLISGDPGAGKSTLALHLAANGFEYHGDDVTLISPDGLARGIACAPTVKSGAWDLVARIRPDLRDAPVYRRPDGMVVRYLQPGAVDQRANPVRWIVFIKRSAADGVEVAPISAADALRRLIEASTCASGKLSVQGFDALRRVLESANSYELTYRNSDEAAEKMAEVCDVSA